MATLLLANRLKVMNRLEMIQPPLGSQLGSNRLPSEQSASAIRNRSEAGMSIENKISAGISFLSTYSAPSRVHHKRRFSNSLCLVTSLPAAPLRALLSFHRKLKR